MAKIVDWEMGEGAGWLVLVLGEIEKRIERIERTIHMPVVARGKALRECKEIRARLESCVLSIESWRDEEQLMEMCDCQQDGSLSNFFKTMEKQGVEHA